MITVQVDETVDKAQLHIETGIGTEKFGQHRRQLASAERGGRIDADQALAEADQLVARAHPMGTSC